MKTEMNFLELHFLVQELQSLVGARLDNVYEPNGLLFQLHKSGAGKLFLRIADTAMWLAKDKPVAPESFSGLCGSLRRYLEGKKLTDIAQVGSERVVQFTFETLKDKFFLFVELFQKGNIILTDSHRKILAAKEERAWRNRDIKRGLEYFAPPAQQNLFEIKDLPKDEKSIASLGFGRLLAKEILARGDFKSLLKEKLSPRAYSDGELSAIKLMQYSEEGEKFPSFSELIDAKLSSVFLSRKQTGLTKAFEAKKVKLQEVIRAQEANISSLEKEAVDLQRKGELIYEHYQELKDLLEELNKIKAKFSLQDMKAKLKGHAKIKDLNPKTSDIIVDI